MSEYELLELTSVYRSETGFHILNFIYVMFGYVAVAYVVGERLSRFQVYAITALYTMFIPLPVIAGLEACETIISMYEEHWDTYPATTFKFIVPYSFELIIATVFLSWAISITFMYQVRRNTAHGREG